jgi:phosphosulfolactate synthase (CoM biosynthesis protein A)
MTRLEKLEESVTALPERGFWQFADRFAQLKAERWDKQIEDDLKAGKLDRLISDAKAETTAGRVKPFAGMN